MDNDTNEDRVIETQLTTTTTITTPEKSNSKKILTGVVETFSMEDADFEAMRRGFNRPAKKTKPIKKEKPVGGDDPSDLNGYLGPWADPFKDTKSLSGPSEVRFNINNLIFDKFVFISRRNFVHTLELLKQISFLLKMLTSNPARKEPFYISNKNGITSAAHTCTFRLI